MIYLILSIENCELSFKNRKCSGKVSGKLNIMVKENYADFVSIALSDSDIDI